jgi:hypothetical protein
MGAEFVNREAREGRKEFQEFFFAFLAGLAVKNFLESR